MAFFSFIISFGSILIACISWYMSLVMREENRKIRIANEYSHRRLLELEAKLKFVIDVNDKITSEYAMLTDKLDKLAKENNNHENEADDRK